MATTLPITAGLLADYTFDEGSGSTAHDRSGNGADMTVDSGGEALLWATDGSGMVFTEYRRLPLPIPIANIRTVVAVANFGAVPSGNGGFAPFLGSDSPPSLDQWWAATDQGGYPSLRFGSSAYQDTVAIPGVPTCLTWVTDPSTGFLAYADNQPGQDLSYGGGTVADPATRVGNAWLGWSAAFNAYFPNFTCSRLAIYNRPLTQAEVTAVAAQVRADAAGRGVTLDAPNPTTANLIVEDGDSITAGAGASDAGTTSWSARVRAALTSYDSFNYGIVGQTIASIDAKWLARRRDKLPGQGRNVNVIFAGTNDLVDNTAGGAVATTLGHAQSLVNKSVQAGYFPVVVPMLDRVGATTAANKNAYNAGLAAALANSPRVTLVPTSALPHLVPDGSCTNTTYFNGDQTHPADAGHQELATAILAAISSIDFTVPKPGGGPTAATVTGSPTLTVGTAATYTVTLDAAAPTGGTTFAPAASGFAATFSPSTVSIAAGATSATFGVTATSAGSGSIGGTSAGLTVTAAAASATTATTPPPANSWPADDQVAAGVTFVVDGVTHTGTMAGSGGPSPEDIAAAVWASSARTLSAFGFSVSVSDKTGFSLAPGGLDPVMVDGLNARQVLATLFAFSAGLVTGDGAGTGTGPFAVEVGGVPRISGVMDGNTRVSVTIHPPA